MSRRIITLTTDFGFGSPYVAELKGAILSVAPDCRLVDVTHNVAPQNVLEGGLTLRQAAPAFPIGAIHVLVVDPGVGGSRAILLASGDTANCIAPDNGLLSPWLAEQTDVELRCVDQPAYWRHPVSRTFHGRDIMGPVAAQLALGRSPAELASPFDATPVNIDLPQPLIGERSIDGQVLAADSFGNLLTNIRQTDVAGAADGVLSSSVGGQRIRHCGAYAEAAPGEVISLVGSSGWLEIAVVQGNAASVLRMGPGDAVRVSW